MSGIIAFVMIIAGIVILVNTFKNEKQAKSRKTATWTSNPVKIKPPVWTNDDPIKTEPPRPVISPTLGTDVMWTDDFIKAIEWKRFEEVCNEFLIIKNYNAEMTCIGADKGIDIIIKNSEGQVACIAQCKAYGKKPIGVALIRELLGIMTSEQVKQGLFFTTSTFSIDAIEFAKNKGITLVDLKSFVRGINTLDKDSRERLYKIASEGDFTIPTCARCDVKMIERVSSKTNKKFWGCANFPKCRMTINIRA
jgi:restriction system protein